MADLTGLKFNRLTVLELVGKTEASKLKWLCKCDCGKTAIVVGGDLKSGNTKSCGCYNSEIIKTRRVTHHMSSTKLYYNYHAMISRCYNSKVDRYKSYGGRGIRVCAEWLESFEEFYKWSMSNGYSDGLSIERIDVNGDYEPSNCKYITKEEQIYNKRDTVKITYNNETKTLMEWAKLLNMKRQTLYSRIYVYKWSIEKAIETPTRKLKCRDYPERE